ncbi:sodium/potassium-transporting ATPase subunit beta-1-like [Patiria miniata]|uniref:Uncharacterized protein n=1 Tax=Patiria miniata TaxID=46514 RepID=A0A913ZIQ5_PATMI|nr:sodium/potassium-transporting ATPase subunit beta-1-like [Patiria miniata]
MSIMINEQQAGPSSQPDGEPIVPVEHDAPASPFVLRRRALGNNIRENWHGFRHFMWNMEKREVMGRNGKSWAQIGLFYLCLYVFLAGYFAAMFAIFYQTISQERPTYNTLITPPGLHVFPIPTGQGRIEYGLDNSDVDRMRFEQEIKDNVFAPLLDIDQSTYENCYNLPPLTINDPQRFCRYDASLLGECAPDNTGYNTTQPCLYMGLNKVWGWIPEGFTSDVLMTQFNKSASFTNRIFFTCDVHEGHQQYVNTLTMFPADGVSFGHYPYVVGTDQAQQARYLRPVVALKVDINTRDQEVRIECRARASNIPDEAPGGLFNSREEPSRFTVRVMVRS